MRRAGLRATAVAAAFALLGAGGAGGCSRKGSPPALSLQPVGDIPFGGAPRRFDYQAVDDAGRRLYVADLGGGRVDVVDVDALTPAGSVDGVDNAHGVRLAPDLHLVFATATGRDEVVAVDTATLTVLRRSPTGRFPDGLAYDPEHGLVAVSNKDAGTETVVDARSGAVRRTVAINREVGNVVYDPVGRRMVVAGRPPDRLVTFDAATGKLGDRIKLAGCDGAHGVALDASGRWAFVGCERNNKLSIVDLEHQRQAALRPVGKSPDVLAVDPGLRRLYVAAEDGVVCVFDIGDPGAVRRLGQGRIDPTAHSVAVDPRTHRVFFPLENVGGQPVLRVMQP
jgi:DNA-binding beta-propeller fold protein YncE